MSDYPDAPNPWDRIYGRVLSDAELDDIKANLAGFFELLHEWAESDTTGTP